MLAFTGWAQEREAYRGPPVVLRNNYKQQYRDITEVWADKMESMGKMPYPWLDWFVLSTSEATELARYRPTRDVPFLNKERSSPDVEGIKM